MRGIKFFKPVLLCLLCSISIHAIAQNLPNIQKESLRAPINIKVDGKIAEWGDRFQAYNKSCDIFYTIANDDDKLYFILQATDADIIRKIIMGGVTFTINGAGKMKDENGVAITFPKYDRQSQPFYIDLSNKPKIASRVNNTAPADSFTNALNDQLVKKLNTVGVAGVTTIADSLLSIYNEEGIRAASFFDNRVYYNYELAIPLKYLELNQSVKFNYNIKFNGIAAHGRNIQINTGGRDIITYTGGDGTSYNLGPTTPRSINITLPTDFWGEYTLVK